MVFLQFLRWWLPASTNIRRLPLGVGHVHVSPSPAQQRQWAPHSRASAVLCCWLQELERHTAAFVEQARLLATWDSAVLSNRHALLDLEAELRGVHAGQEALDRQLGMIETHQKVGR